MTGVDSNVVLYACMRDDPRAERARAEIERLRQNGTLVVIPQVLQEYLSVITRPPPRGALLAPALALSVFSELIGESLRAPRANDLRTEIDRIVAAVSPRGARVHDAALAAAYLALGARELCTFNLADFKGMGIEAREPG